MGGSLNDSLYYPGIIFSFDACDLYGPLETARLDQIEVNREFPGTPFEVAVGSLRLSPVVSLARAQLRDIQERFRRSDRGV